MKDFTSYKTIEAQKEAPQIPGFVYTGKAVVMDGGKLSALERLGMRPAGYLAQQFERSGYTVSTIRRGETINAHVDLAELWDKTRKEIELQQVVTEAARLGGGSDAVE